MKLFDRKTPVLELQDGLVGKPIPTERTPGLAAGWQRVSDLPASDIAPV